jgi:hypothetical protein
MDRNTCCLALRKARESLTSNQLVDRLDSCQYACIDSRNLIRRLGMRLYPVGSAAWRRVLIPVAGSLAMGANLKRRAWSNRARSNELDKERLWLPGVPRQLSRSVTLIPGWMRHHDTSLARSATAIEPVFRISAGNNSCLQWSCAETFPGTEAGCIECRPVSRLRFTTESDRQSTFTRSCD